MGSSSGFLKNTKFFFKGFVALVALLISATYGVLCSIFLTLIGKKKLSQWSTARFFYHFFSNLMGITIKIDHPERLNDLPAILISNHQTELDIFMLGRIFPQRCTVTAKKQLKYIPFLGWFMSLSGTFFLDRSNRESAVNTLNKALEDLKTNKDGLFMFPEGTRSYSTKPVLLPFKKGAFHLAVAAGIPIIPLVVSNYSNIYSPKLKNFNTGTINIKVLEKIETEGLTKDDVNKLVEDTYNKMNAASKDLGFSDVNGDYETEIVESDDENEGVSAPITSAAENAPAASASASASAPGPSEESSSTPAPSELTSVTGSIKKGVEEVNVEEVVTNESTSLL